MIVDHLIKINKKLKKKEGGKMEPYLAEHCRLLRKFGIHSKCIRMITKIFKQVTGCNLVLLYCRFFKRLF